MTQNDSTCWSPINSNPIPWHCLTWRPTHVDLVCHATQTLAIVNQIISIMTQYFGIISQLRLSTGNILCVCLCMCTYTKLSFILFLTNQFQNQLETHSHSIPSHTHMTILSLSQNSIHINSLSHNGVLAIYSTTSQHHSNSITYILSAY